MLITLRRRRIALVRLLGTIGVAIRPSDFVPLFNSLQTRRGVEAVVLEIDSRGGSASASDYIHNGVAELAREKPVFAFTGNLCASGGYMIACAARQLVVQPSALVGSIGVISIRPLAEELMRRLGLSVSVTKSGKLKDMGAFWRKPTDEELGKEDALVHEYFEIFIDRILKGRSIEPEQLRKLATGEVFSGRQAVELGLADRLGSLRDTIELAARTAGVAPKWRLVGPRQTLRARLTGGVASRLADEIWERGLALSASEPHYR